jgi:outer membrane protein assembly factor BamB
MKSPLKNSLVPLIAIALVQPVSATDWPQWRGPDRTGVSQETGLLRSWPAAGPKRVWLYERAGSGYSGPAIVSGKLFTMGTRDDSECMLAIDAANGAELWAAKIGPVYKEQRGDGPRATPTVDGDRAYAMTAQGELACVSVSDGKILWHQNMSDLGGRMPHWGYSESVVVDGDHVICTPGGTKGALAALDKKTGKLAWQSAEFTEPAHYSSIVTADINNTRQYIQRTERSVVGISARDGKLLWKAAFPGRVAVVPTPVFKDNQVYVTAGYGAGCKLIRIGPGNETTDVYENKVIKNHHGGVVLVGDHIYGHADPGWVCQNLKTGEEVWSERNALGKGAIACADGMLYCLDESNGTLVLIEASPGGWKEHGRFKLDPQTKIRSSDGRIWTHPVISNGRLYLRDQDLIYCYDVKAG